MSAPEGLNRLATEDTLALVRVAAQAAADALGQTLAVNTGHAQPLTADELNALTVTVTGAVQAAVTGAVAVNNLPDQYPDQHEQPLTRDQLDAAAVLTQATSDRELQPVTALVENPAATVIHAPAPGRAIRLHWFYALNNPASDTPALITAELGDTPLYLSYGITKSQRFTGAVDAPLRVRLNVPGQVAVTALFEEIDP